MNEMWDLRFLELARFVSQWSKDPSTKNGSVIVDTEKRVVSMGYNGFPRGVKDYPNRYIDREIKYPMICHAERNAILFARQDLRGTILYTTFTPCSICAGMIIQAGIYRVVALKTIDKELEKRWSKDLELTTQMFVEAGIQLDIY